MKIVKVEPADGGEKSDVTISMTAHEVHMFAQALHEGKLAHLGITGASFSKSDSDGTDNRWTETERRKCTPSPKSPKHR
jgi:hypothetical protein